MVIAGRLIITAQQIEENILRTARFLDHYRELLGNKPIKVTSWYRPSSVNVRVGGGKYSHHQYGDAVDWISHHYSPSQIARILEPNHTNGGYKAYSGFTHTDWRGRKARW